jgi:ComF family protein
MVGRKKIIQQILDLFFPPRCPVCDGILGTAELRSGSRIHAQCEKKLCPVTEPACFHCGRPLREQEREYCEDCTSRRSALVQGKSLYAYRDAAKQSMYRFKYGNRREYARFFAEEAERRLLSWIRDTGVEVLVPVPMYPKKERRRGYNQAKLFARALAERLELAYEPSMVRRVRDTRPQKELGVEERENNLKNAFQVADFVVKYNYVLIVDDIYTTGCTAETIARELQRAGVEKVYVLSVCIAVGF